MLPWEKLEACLLPLSPSLSLSFSRFIQLPYLWIPGAFKVERYKDKEIFEVEVERGDSNGPPESPNPPPALPIQPGQALGPTSPGKPKGRSYLTDGGTKKGKAVTIHVNSGSLCLALAFWSGGALMDPKF
ncbi:unnamed protein product [Prunus armeniaca]